jgi:hypothetical protein
MTDHVRNHLTAWDHPTEEQIAERKSKIDKVCDEIDALGDRENLTVNEFDSVRHRLDEHFAYPLLTDLNAVVHAIQNQRVRT